MNKLNKTTYKNIAKNNPRDLVEIEYGDSKDLTKFQPQQKIQRWDNECNVSIRLIEDATELKEKATIIQDGEKIKHIKKNRECHFYNIQNTEHPEGASEFEVILKKDPRKNKKGDYTLEFSLEDKDVDYFYQPALTPQEIAEGAKRPENVEGSYAIYAKTPKTNYVGGKEYKVGKIGHIPFPYMIDANGWKVRAKDLNINQIGKRLKVVIPQAFLDKAVYPVRHAAGLTMGYSTAGASYTARTSASACRGLTRTSGTITAATGDTITLISVYAQNGGGGSGSAGVSVYSNVADIPTTRLLSEETITINGAVNWYTTGALSQAMSNGVKYNVAIGNWNKGTATELGFWYDAKTAGDNSFNAAGALPATWTETSTDANRLSIYATYTAGGGGAVTPNHLMRLMGCGNG